MQRRVDAGPGRLAARAAGSRGRIALSDDVIDLDERRGLASRAATDSRRLVADVEANEQGLRQQREALVAALFAIPAAT
jgi:hypothetical protein